MGKSLWENTDHPECLPLPNCSQTLLYWQISLAKSFVPPHKHSSTSLAWTSLLTYILYKMWWHVTAGPWYCSFKICGHWEFLLLVAPPDCMVHVCDSLSVICGFLDTRTRVGQNYYLTKKLGFPLKEYFCGKFWVFIKSFSVKMVLGGKKQSFGVSVFQWIVKNV